MQIIKHEYHYGIRSFQTETQSAVILVKCLDHVVRYGAHKVLPINRLLLQLPMAGPCTQLVVV